METILFLAHTQADGALPNVAREALAAAIDIAGKLSGSTLKIGLIGQIVKAAADSIAACGAGPILVVAGAEFAESRYATDAAAVAALAKAAGATIVVAPGTSRFSRA